MAPTHALVMVHGMVPDPSPSSPFPQYEAFWQALRRREPGLNAAIARRIGVQWGHEMPYPLSPQDLATAVAWGYNPPADPTRTRPDEKLTDAQIYLGSRVIYNNVRSDPSPQNIVLKRPLRPDDSLIFFLRSVIEGLRENTLLRGFGDAVYYCSEEGEKITRRQVYGQILTQLDALNAPDELHLHLVGHSLGATVAHDFFYGLFAPNHRPDFLNQATRTARTQFEQWRAKAQSGILKLGSFVTMGSQLPLFVQRVQRLIEQLADNRALDPSVLGIAVNDPNPRWINFYDIDDLLGFPTRRMYTECPALVEVQVDSGDMPDRAHIDYWVTPDVINRTAALIAANAV